MSNSTINNQQLTGTQRVKLHSDTTVDGVGAVRHDFDALTANWNLYEDFVFKSGASGGTKNIGSIADLQAHFLHHPAPAANGQSYVTHNGYYKYVPYSDPLANQTYVFTADGLVLTPTCQFSFNGQLKTQVPANAVLTSGVATAKASWGVADTSSMWVGRVVLLPYASIASGFVTAFDANTITVRSFNPYYTGDMHVALTQTCLAIWTNMTAMQVPVGFAAGVTSVTVANAPAQVQNGMALCSISDFATVNPGADNGTKLYNSGFAQRHTYGATLTKAGNVLTVSAPGMHYACPNGGYVISVPIVDTPNLISNIAYPEPGIGQAWCFELDWIIPGINGILPKTRYMNDLATFNALGGDNLPLSTWASFWMYEDHLPPIVQDDQGFAEIDITEVWGGVENGIDKTSCAWHSNISVYGGLTDTGGNSLPTSVFDDEGKPTYVRVGQGWSAYMDQSSGTVFSSFTGDRPMAHKRQCVWTKDCVVVYENNKPLVRFRGSHASRRGLKLWMNASQGGLDYLRSLQWPLSDAGLANSKVTLKRLTVKNVGF